MSNKLRSFRFDDKTMSLILSLKESLGLESNSMVIRRAITLLKLAADAKADGGSVVIRTPEGDKGLML